MTGGKYRLLVILLLLNLLIVSARLSAESGGLAFVSEIVSIEVIEPRLNAYGIQVRGLYSFHNFSSKQVERRIFYPFPIGGGSLYPESVRLSYVGDTGAIGAIPFTRLEKGVAFILTAGADAERTVEVKYTQLLEGSTAVYITTTTAGWVKPLERAEFIVSLPEALRIKEISYPPDRVLKKDGMTSCMVSYVDFMPAEDLTLSWEKYLETSGSEVTREAVTPSD